jgi:hypothetical protein
MYTQIMLAHAVHTHIMHNKFCAWVDSDMPTGAVVQKHGFSWGNSAMKILTFRVDISLKIDSGTPAASIEAIAR